MENKQSLYVKVKETLAVVSQFIITAPLKLPPKVVAVARYVALAIGVLEAVEAGMDKHDEGDDENG